MSEPSPKGLNGRDSSGRFAKGWQGGPGNPFNRKVGELRSALIKSLTIADMQEIALSLKEKAMAGDMAAMKLLLEYSIGKPQPAIDPDRLDEHELETLKGRPSAIDLLVLETEGKV